MCPYIDLCCLVTIACHVDLFPRIYTAIRAIPLAPLDVVIVGYVGSFPFTLLRWCDLIYADDGRWRCQLRIHLHVARLFIYLQPV